MRKPLEDQNSKQRAPTLRLRRSRGQTLCTDRKSHSLLTSNVRSVAILVPKPNGNASQGGDKVLMLEPQSSTYVLWTKVAVETSLSRPQNTVLLVEDSDVHRLTIKWFLTSLGYAVETVRNAEAALAVQKFWRTGYENRTKRTVTPLPSFCSAAAGFHGGRFGV